MDAGIQKRNEQIHQLSPATAEPIGPQQQHGPRLTFRKRLADSPCVAAHQVGLQLCQAAIGNADVGELAKSGVHAVNRLSSGQNALNELAASGDAGQCCGGDPYRPATQGYSFNFKQGERLTVQKQSIHLLQFSGFISR